MTGPRVHDCTECDSRGGGRCEESGAWAPCEWCDGSTKLADCIECGEPRPLPSAERVGGFCEACARSLDMSDAEAEARRLRWTA
jgi:hypothetical protein